MKTCYKFLVSLLLIAFSLSASHGDDSFYPEAVSALKQGKVWSKVDFGEGSEANVFFRVWYPYASDPVWEVLTDTNSWKKIHRDYTDSATLDKNQLDAVKAKKITSVDDYYALVGKTTTFPSDFNRKKGSSWISYVFQRFNMPWPFKDKWCVIEIKNDETNAKQGEYRYTYQMAAGNFKKLEGYWHILPVKDRPGWTEFRGEYLTDAGISAPKFLTRGIVRASLARCTMENRKVLRKKGAQQAK